MSILEEIEQALEIKLRKYKNSGLSAEQWNKLVDMLIIEAVAEVMFSAATMCRS